MHACALTQRPEASSFSITLPSSLEMGSLRTETRLVASKSQQSVLGYKIMQTCLAFKM